MAANLRQLMRRKTMLWNDRSSFEPHWRDLSNFFLPRNGRFFTADKSRGAKRHNHIIDNEATLAVNILDAGMMSGASSPARPWFRYKVADHELMRNHEVRDWLHESAQICHDILNGGNTYDSLHGVYRNLAVFGTAPTIVLPDFENVIHHYPVAIGQYAIAQDYRGNVDTFYREMSMTVAQMAQAFGEDKLSVNTKNKLTNKNIDDLVTVIHAIERRENRNYEKVDDVNMPWQSCYFELSEGNEEGKPLRESGFKEFPVLCPRWDLEAEDVYGSSPGMLALGDNRQLQHQQKAKGHAINLLLDPPLQVPSSIKNKDIDSLPGGRNYYDQMTGAGGGIRPLFEVGPSIQPMSQDMDEVRVRIRRALHTDMFLLLANSVDQEKTATEAAILDEEKRMVLGPVLNRLHRELLGKLAVKVFEEALKNGALPPVPADLIGMDLSVEFVSTLAQAQKLIGLGVIDRLIGTVTSLGAIKPEAFDKLDADEIVDEYAHRLGVPPKQIVPTGKLRKVREARSRALAAKEQNEMANTQADTANKLSKSPTGPGQRNALMDLNNLNSNYAIPSAVETG